MKKVIMTMTVGATLLAVAADGTVGAACSSTNEANAKVLEQAAKLDMTTEAFLKLPKDERKSMLAAKSAERQELQAKKLGISVEELKKLSPEERKRRLAIKHDEKMQKQAARVGMDVEKFKNLPLEERMRLLKNQK